MTRIALTVSLYSVTLCLLLAALAGIIGRGMSSQGQIAYMAFDLRGVRLWVLDPAYGVAVALVDHAFTGPSMFPSPDGQQLAFFRETDGSAHLHIINADGSNLRQLEDVTPDLAIAWLPDSREIVVASAYGTNSQYNVSDLTSTPLPTRAVPGCGLPVLSPNGRRVATSLFEVDGSFFCRSGGIALMDADSGANVVEFLPGEFDLSPVWSPDGERLALFGPGGLFVAADAHTSSDVPLDDNHVGIDDNQRAATAISRTGLYTSLAAPVWSPDGTRLALVMDGMFDVYLVPVLPEVGDPINLTPQPSTETYPTWSPDGTHIAFVSNRQHGTEIYTVDVTTRDIRRVTYNNTSELNLVWLP